jgi:peptidoglycan hydrolase-like protein with peptidoglycan-binding domain
LLYFFCVYFSVLKVLGHYTGTIDGIYGKGTERAVKLYQTQSNLHVDGILTDELLNHIENNTKK